MKKRILLVEDDSHLSRVLAENLAFCGFEVGCVGDGNEVIGRLRSFRPDLVLLDVMLPGQTGFDLCGLIRRSGQTPVIILTARDQKADKVRAFEMGADDYITKPFDFDELRARVRAVLRRARLDIVKLTLGGVTVDFEKLRASDGD
ncbi:MAG TPA: response regulator, partial [Vicinamibacterales bacterium]|nr:response regulator [Vicinamibacterales bacterium]